MAAATDQLEVSFPRARPNSVGCSIAQPGGVPSVTRVPFFSATGEEQAWTEVLWEPTQGTLHHQALCFRWFHKGRKEWLLLCEDGTCGHWRCMEQPATDLGMTRSDPPVQWLKLRNFSCTGCGTIPVHNLSCFPEPKDRQPATLHGPDGRRIELHSVIYVETLKRLVIGDGLCLTKP